MDTVNNPIFSEMENYLQNTNLSHNTVMLLKLVSQHLYCSGADPGFDQGGPQIVTGLKLPFWGLSFVEFWCWGLIFGGQGGPPWIRPCCCFVELDVLGTDGLNHISVPLDEGRI